MSLSDLLYARIAEIHAVSPWAVLLGKTTLLVLVAWLLHLALARANPRWRVFLWRGVTVGLVLLAGWSVGLPGLEIRVSVPQRVAPAPRPDPVQAAAGRDASNPPSSYELPTEAPVPVEMMATTPPTPVEISPEPADSSRSSRSGVSWHAVLLGIWGFGVAALVVRLALGYFRLAGLLRTMQDAPEEIIGEARRIAAVLGCRGTVQVRTSPEFAVPFVYGFRRSVLVLPERMCRPAYHSQLPGIIAHELAHVRLWDFGWNVVLQVGSILLWFHPLVWRIASAHRAACDAVCDAVSASHVGDVHAYCRTLARVALEGAASFPAAGLAMARACDVRRRIAVLERGLFASPLGRRSVIGVSVTGLLACALLAGMRLALAESPPKASLDQIDAVATGDNASPSEPKPAAEKSARDGGATTPSEPPALLTAFGTVVDPAGKPVAGASVYLRAWYVVSHDPFAGNPTDILAKTASDAHGAFRFDNVPAQPLPEQWLKQIPWDVVVIAKPYAIAWRHLDAAQQLGSMEIKLAPEASVSGRVTDQQGQPVQNAQVALHSIDPLGSDWPCTALADPGEIKLQGSRLAPAARTDADGRVTFTGLPRDARLYFGVMHRDFGRSAVFVAITDQPQPDIEVPGSFDGASSKHMARVYPGPFSVTLAPALPRLTGRVIAADTKKPLPRVPLFWGPASWTDQEGRFVLNDIRDSRCRVLVFSPKNSDYLGRLVFVDMARDKKETQVDIELDRGQTVSGSVVDRETGKGVADVIVNFDTGFDVTASKVGGPVPGSDRTDSEGRFRLVVPLGKGKVKIWGEVRGYDLPRPSGRMKTEIVDGFFKEIEVIAGKATPAVKFTLRRTAPKQEPPLVRREDSLGSSLTKARRTVEVTVAGSVTDPDGKPVAGADVGLPSWFSDVKSEHQPVQTDQQGRFALRVKTGMSPEASLGIPETIVAICPARKLRGHVLMPDTAPGEAA
jgi:beta-lactamase regulating signal transducer with metallopeptidase domain/protocatechuate 3,4-dioxygenase beta subunit